MANTLKHKTLPSGVDRPGFTGITPSLYAEEHAFAGGALGSVLVRNAGNSDGAAWIQSLNGVLVSTGTNLLPSFSTTLPNAVQDNITRTGTVVSGVWNAGSVTTNSAAQVASIGATGYAAIVGNTKPGIKLAQSGTLGYEISSGNGLPPFSDANPVLLIQDVSFNGILTGVLSLARTTAAGVTPAAYSLVPADATAFISLGDPASNAVHLQGVYSNNVYGYAGFKERFRSAYMGEWTNVAYNAGNFTANAGTWTVDVGDQVRYSYMLIGKTMFLQFSLSSTSVSNAGSSLRIAVPGGFTIAGNTRTIVSLIDNGGAITAGIADAVSSNAYIILYASVAGTGWAISTNNSSVTGQISFEVN